MSKTILALALAAGFALSTVPAFADGPSVPRRPETRHPGFFQSPTDESAAPRKVRRTARPSGGDSMSLTAMFRAGRFDPHPLGDASPSSGPVYSYMPREPYQYDYAPPSPATVYPLTRDYLDAAPCPTNSRVALAPLFACTWVSGPTAQ